jgi:1-propanol dehydrogenase
MANFSLPTQVQIGDASELLSDVNTRRILIVCDSFLADSDNLKSIITSLSEHNLVQLFTEVQPDPTADDIAAGITKLRLFRPDLLIAYGGGSAIDLAKAINHTQHNLGSDKLEFIAIPTTSGTGSEVTSASVISIPQKNQKIPLFDNSLLPERAILDSKQTVTVPAQVTVFTGIDVLTHSIESIVATGASDFSDALAEKAAGLVFQFLAAAIHDPKNIEARSALQNASCMAGIAFNHAGLGIAHAIAHQIGATMHVPHGKANALVLIPSIQYNRQCKTASRAYARLSRVLGFATKAKPDAVAVNALIEAIERLYKQVDFNPATVLDAKQTQTYIAHMTDSALKDFTLTTNPIQPRAATIRSMIESI